MAGIADKPEFLLRIDGDYFMKDVAISARGGLEVRGTRVISEALHFDFNTAERKCQQLRKRGYPYAVTTTLSGQPVTPAILRGEEPPEKDDLPRTEKDIDKIPAEEFKRRMKTDAPFVGRVHEIWKLKTEGQTV